MSLFIWAIILAVIFAVITIIIVLNDDEIGQYCTGAICFIFIIIAFCSGWIFESAKRKAAFLNKTYGTEYTQEDIFWTGSTIEKTILEIKDKKIHVDIE